MTPETQLKKLPLPLLENSFTEALKALEPLQSPEEYLKSKSILSQLPKNKLLKILQSHLEDYDKKHPCYLDLFSNFRDHNVTNIYSEYRGKTLPKNPYFILENDPNFWSLLPPTQSERAAILTFSTLKFISSVKQNKLKPDVTPKSKSPLSMNSLNYLFGTTRFPSKNGNGINVKNYPGSKHLIVLCNNNFYFLKVLNDKNDVIIDQLNLQKIFQYIIDTNEQTTDVFKPSVSSLTTESRSQWQECRKLLQSNEKNKENLELIDSSLIIVNLDLNSFIINDEKVNYLNICHGTSNIDETTGIQKGSCTSRWYDKLQLLISKDSLAAVLWEPTSSDATIVLRYVSDIYTDSILRLARNIQNLEIFSLWSNDVVVKNEYNELEKITCEPGYFQRLRWDFDDEPILNHKLRLAENRLGDLLCQFDFKNEIIDFGFKNATSLNALNADSLIQLAIQLSHYALYGKAVTIGESISMRRFEHSRSELCFTQNSKLIRICQNFISNSKNRWDNIIEGVEEINNIKHKCRIGEGFEKHLKALKLAYLQRDYLNQIKSEDVEDIPSEDDVPGFLLYDMDLLFDPDILAINCGNPSLKAFGITPFKPDGFGIGYVIKDESTIFTISSNFRQNDRFLETLRWILKEFERLYKESTKCNLSVIENTITAVSMGLSESFKRKQEFEENILGGYGYFDVGDLEFRSSATSRQLSRVQSELSMFKLS